MDKNAAYTTLVQFAEKRLNAAAYSDCTHRFCLWECGCGSTCFRLTIERYAGDTPGDFHGILRAQCAACGQREERLSILSGGAPKLLRSERPRCACGVDALHVGLCERWEDWGFFDEGTVVGACSACGTLMALVDTD